MMSVLCGAHAQFVFGLLAALAMAGPALGQAVDPKTKIPPPEEVELKDKNGLPLTKDGVILKATFYPGLLKEKSIPVLLLHGYKGNRTEYAGLALYLQTHHGHAVLVPDLRGHGDSTKIAGNTTKTLEADRLGPNDFDAMVVQDVEACKKFLMEKNNAGELNIEKLCVVGAEMGAVVAMNWAIMDWSWPRLATGKQGQDVKAIVMLSPIFQVPKSQLNLTKPLNSPLQSNLSVSVIYGGTNAKRPYVADAKRVETSLTRFHTDATEQTLFVDPVDTSLQGTKLLTEPALNLNTMISEFIKVRLVSKDHPWKDRSGP